MTGMGPNDVPCVVWAIGEFFFFLSNFFNYLLCFIVYSMKMGEFFFSLDSAHTAMSRSIKRVVRVLSILKTNIILICKKPIPIPLGMIPTPIPIAKPVSTRTHESWVRVQTDTGKDRVKNTHGLPGVPITRWDE